MILWLSLIDVIKGAYPMPSGTKNYALKLVILMILAKRILNDQYLPFMSLTDTSSTPLGVL